MGHGAKIGPAKVLNVPQVRVPSLDANLGVDRSATRTPVTTFAPPGEAADGPRSTASLATLRGNKIAITTEIRTEKNRPLRRLLFGMVTASLLPASAGRKL